MAVAVVVLIGMPHPAQTFTVTQLADITPVVGNSVFDSFTVFNNELVFRADDGTGTDLVLWRLE